MQNKVYHNICSVLLSVGFQSILTKEIVPWLAFLQKNPLLNEGNF